MIKNIVTLTLGIALGSFLGAILVGLFEYHTLKFIFEMIY